MMNNVLPPMNTGGSAPPAAGGMTGMAGVTPMAGMSGLGGSGGGTSGGTSGMIADAGPMLSPDGGTAGSQSPPSMAGSTADPPAMACETEEEEKFSFFLISYEAIIRESGKMEGFGGNLGGISGADDICRRVALTSSKCAGNKTWHAFLSTTKEDAIDRIGEGPWHDRLGRVFALRREDLIADRPTSADPAIIDDLPNEFGVPNHDPDGTGLVDNHQTLTGSGTDGRLYEQAEGSGMPMQGGGPFGGGMTQCNDGGWSPEKATCWDWTRAEGGCPRVGHSWPRQGSGINWISVWNEGGCAAGVTLDDRTAPDMMSVGSFGGYGGWYCFGF